jgi:hypothetical protein
MIHFPPNLLFRQPKKQQIIEDYSHCQRTFKFEVALLEIK